MAATLHVADLGDVSQCLDRMNQVLDQADQLRTYAATEVANKAGFVGLLEPLAGAMDIIAAATSQASTVFEDRYRDCIAAVRATAHDIDARDGDVSGDFAPAISEAEEASAIVQKMSRTVGGA